MTWAKHAAMNAGQASIGANAQNEPKMKFCSGSFC
jgi:hypothetical protein